MDKWFIIINFVYADVCDYAHYTCTLYNHAYFTYCHLSIMRIRPHENFPPYGIIIMHMDADNLYNYIIITMSYM